LARKEIGGSCSGVAKGHSVQSIRDRILSPTYCLGNLCGLVSGCGERSNGSCVARSSSLLWVDGKPGSVSEYEIFPHRHRNEGPRHHSKGRSYSAAVPKTCVVDRRSPRRSERGPRKVCERNGSGSRSAQATNSRRACRHRPLKGRFSNCGSS